MTSATSCGERSFSSPSGMNDFRVPIDEILEGMAGDRAVLEPVDRKGAAGDVVSVRIRPVDADPDETDEESKPYRFELGAGYAIPDVESAILTLDPGGSGTFDVAYPADFGTRSWPAPRGSSRSR